VLAANAAPNPLKSTCGINEHIFLKTEEQKVRIKSKNKK
jgi:hypothetical protein